MPYETQPKRIPTGDLKLFGLRKAGIGKRIINSKKRQRVIDDFK
jgi:hypothetical protein